MRAGRSAAKAGAANAATVDRANTNFFTLNNPLYQSWAEYIDNRNLDVSQLAPACRRGHCEGYNVASQADCLLLWQGRYRLAT